MTNCRTMLHWIHKDCNTYWRNPDGYMIDLPYSTIVALYYRRENGELSRLSYRITCDNIRDLYNLAYRMCRSCIHSDCGTRATFRIRQNGKRYTTYERVIIE